jgi:hypothetical protein
LTAGNHDGDYLREELRYIDALLRPGGLLIIDDIGTSFWEGVRAVFENLSSGGGEYTQLGTDGRVGVFGASPPSRRWAGCQPDFRQQTP